VRTPFPTAKIAPAACHLPRLHDHDSTTREDLGGGGGARGPGPARAGLLQFAPTVKSLKGANTLVDDGSGNGTMVRPCGVQQARELHHLQRGAAN
jgi:hypothetical protein